MPNFNDTARIPKGLLLAALAALTLALLFGIKFFMSDDTSSGAFPQEVRQDLFKGDQQIPGRNPAARSETGSGGGLDMFSKTNAGYYGEEESTGTAEAPQAAPRAPKAAAAPAAGKAAGKPKTKSTVIPRMKPANFGGIAPTNVAPAGAGQGMPDISGMLKQAQQQGRPPAQDDGE